MESEGHREDDGSSDQEGDQENNNDVGSSTSTGRSYDCMFCKRGFSTAQALGGHMNIHRKDRAKNRPPASSIIDDSNKHDHATTPIFTQHPISSSYLQPPPPQHINYRTYFPAAGTRPPPSSYAYNYHDHNVPQRLNPFGEDWRMSLSLQLIGSSHAAGDHVEKKKQGESDQEHELDLELRLGHDP